ncbi:M3 family metallopeptidase [Longimicrobium sp.]|uniref:M3 family metallopeptidase n=1 Tax=Longimicrobium sp. TaxID=2029185 RepID=UPI002B753651|nr:M3 family metallopeptidase [Longimicrobium sp.]HSU16052.1 M3 family metallopeptidase [Longimicrobium sp.]
MTVTEDLVDTNPLLSRELPIAFGRITPEHVVPAIRHALAEAERELEELVAHPGERTYENTLARLDEVGERLGRVIRPVSHLVHVLSSPELRGAYEEVLPEFSAFYARLPLDPRLWQVIRDFAETGEAKALSGVRARHLEKTVLAFRRAGADLPPDRKARVEELKIEQSRILADFSNHVLDSTNAWELVLTDEADLAGLPESARTQARAAAQAKGVDGWRFTLHQPSWQPFMQYAERRDLRQRIHQAYMSRASEGPHDNRPIIRRVLEIRRELAGLLGYRDWADYVLEDSMARSGGRAVRFEEDLTERTRPFWEREKAELEAFAREELGLERLEPWDTAFAVERMRLARYDLDAEALRPYFPLDRVLEGMFEITRRLFGVSVRPVDAPADELWHPQVRAWEMEDESGTVLGRFYTDWYPRESKRAGAWMNGLIVGGPRPEGWEPHLALIAANVSPPEGARPALLTHREVETVFHEFGHMLHHMLSRVEVAELGGTHVPADWVELPSQIMENWTWERPALDLFARHWQTGEPIPDELYAKMQAARTFMAAHFQMRQLAFGTVDLDLHVAYDPASGQDVVERAQEVMGRFTHRPEFARDHFITSFSHIFSGGYAAGYYSYLWSEVLDADAFSRFEREGLFNRETGRAFVDCVLSRGDDTDPDQLFREFMGRDPDPEALLRRNLGAE